MPTPTTQPKTQNQPTTAKTPAPSACQIRALTEKLAYEIWEKNGRKHGQDVQNWIEAEKIARKNLGI